MRTLKRLLSRQATVALATHVVDDGFRYDCRTPKLVANAPSTFSTAASQPAKSWPTTCPFASMSGDPELPPYVPPTSLVEKTKFVVFRPQRGPVEVMIDVEYCCGCGPKPGGAGC